MMLISVITIVTTNLDELAETLESQRQAYVYASPQVDLQVVIVAPDFDEHLEKVILEAELAGPVRIDKVCDQGLGIAAAFNAGMREAKGELITVLNAGDLWFENTLCAAHRAHRRSPQALVHSAITFEDQSGARYVVASHPHRLKRRMSIFHPTLFVPYEMQRAIGEFDERYRLAMDSNWCHRAIAAGVSFEEAESSLAIMRLGGRSDVGYAVALAEFRTSVVEEGLCSSTEAYLHYWRVKLVKDLTHLPVFRRWLSGWRASAQRIGRR